MSIALRDLGTSSRSARARAADRSDAELLEQVRAGDDEAYGELYRRHEPAATRFARQLERSSAAADDLVADSFTAVLATLHNGAGPTEAFRPYLLTTVRRRHWRRSRTPEEPADPTDGSLDGAILDADTEDGRLMIEAYRQLPERWQLVLWHTEIEGSSPAEVAPLVGLSPHATAALAHRAREGLREAYLQAHLQAGPPADCQDTVSRMGAIVRGNLGRREQVKSDAHLADCEHCQGLRTELSDVNRALRSLVAPAVLGAGAAAYLGRRATSAPATSAIAHSLRGSGRRVAVVGTTLAVTVGLLVARSDLTHRSPAADSAAEPTASPSAGADASAPTSNAPSVRTVALPDGPGVTSVPGALGATCAAGAIAVGDLASTGAAEGSIVSAVLVRGDLGGLAAVDPGAVITPITGSALTALQALTGTRPSSGNNAAATPSEPASTCVTVATTTLLAGSGAWHLLIGYVPTGAGPGADDVQFAVLARPFALLGSLTRTAVGTATSVLDAVVSALPGIVPALTGQLDPSQLGDLSAVSAVAAATLGDVLGAVGTGADALVDDISGPGTILDDLTGDGGGDSATGGTGGGIGSIGGTGSTGGSTTGGGGTGTPVDPPPTGPTPTIPPVTVPGPLNLPPITVPQLPLPLPPLQLPPLGLPGL